MSKAILYLADIREDLVGGFLIQVSLQCDVVAKTIVMQIKSWFCSFVFVCPGEVLLIRVDFCRLEKDEELMNQTDTKC